MRSRILALQDKCVSCPSAIGLQVHHATYERLGKESDEDLFVVCDSCHGSIHKYFKKTKGSGVTLQKATEYILFERKRTKSERRELALQRAAHMVLVRKAREELYKVDSLFWRKPQLARRKLPKKNDKPLSSYLRDV